MGRHPPAAPRRERAARADLGGIGQAVALELAREEATQEGEEPAADVAQGVAPPERVDRHAGDALRAEAEAHEVVQEEVVEIIRSHELLGQLADLTVHRRTAQLGADWRLEYLV